MRAKRFHVQRVELLDAGASVQPTAMDGITPLHLAAADGHVDVMKRLASAGSTVDVARKSGATPLFDAAEGGHLSAVRWLLGHSATVNAPDEVGDIELPNHPIPHPCYMLC